MPQFLSEEWIEAAKAIREEYRDRTGTPPHVVKMNLNIKECPDGVGQAGTVEAHMDSTEGDMEMDLGHMDSPQLTVTLPYDVAKALLVEGNPQAAMAAFMAGKIVVNGDMTRLMALQQPGVIDPVQLEIAGRVQAITD